ncbi:MAG TPA: tubulin-like doman-containing protein [Tepidiformaceae bacterium]|nr:tubulin-like doman-containing protein [Tepidiformaceae bacterium]
MQATIVIGVGGTGIAVASAFCRRLKKGSPENTKVGILLIDYPGLTDKFQEMRGELVTEFGAREWDLKQHPNLWGDIQGIRRGSPHRVDPWLRTDHPIANIGVGGVGADRFRGKVGYFVRSFHEPFTTWFAPVMQQVTSAVDGGGDPIIWVVGSVSGGTGSGIIPTVANEVRRAVQGLTAQVYACLITPEAMRATVNSKIPMMAQQSRAGSWAALQELNFWQTASLAERDSVSPAWFHGNAPMNFDAPPFDMVFHLNHVTEDGRTFEGEQVFSLGGDLILASALPADPQVGLAGFMAGAMANPDYSLRNASVAVAEVRFPREELAEAMGGVYSRRLLSAFFARDAGVTQKAESEARASFVSKFLRDDLANRLALPESPRVVEGVAPTRTIEAFQAWVTRLPQGDKERVDALRTELWRELEAEVYNRLRGEGVGEGRRVARAEGYLRAARGLPSGGREEMLREADAVGREYEAALERLNDSNLERMGANVVKRACEASARATRVRVTHEEIRRVLEYVGARAEELENAFERANRYVSTLIPADAPDTVESVVSNDARHIFVVPPLNSPELSIPEPVELDAGLADSNKVPWSMLLVDHYRNAANFETEFTAFRQAVEAHGRKRCAGELERISIWDALRFKSGDGEWPGQALRGVFERLEGVSGAAWTPNSQLIFRQGAAQHPSAMAVTDTTTLTNGIKGVTNAADWVQALISNAVNFAGLRLEHAPGLDDRVSFIRIVTGVPFDAVHGSYWEIIQQEANALRANPNALPIWTDKRFDELLPRGEQQARARGALWAWAVGEALGIVNANEPGVAHSTLDDTGFSLDVNPMRTAPVAPFILPLKDSSRTAALQMVIKETALAKAIYEEVSAHLAPMLPAKRKDIGQKTVEQVSGRLNAAFMEGPARATEQGLYLAQQETVTEWIQSGVAPAL